jgi:hypothetical protein
MKCPHLYVILNRIFYKQVIKQFKIIYADSFSGNINDVYRIVNRQFLDNLIAIMHEKTKKQ